MVRFLYIEVDIVCIIMLILFTGIIRSSNKKLFDERLYSFMAVNMVIILALDLLWASIDGIGGPLLRIPNEIICVLFFFLGSIECYLLLLYSDFKSRPDIEGIKSRGLLFAIPLIFLLALHVVNLKYGMIFYIDENNVYHRGDMHYFQWIIPNLYLAFSVLLNFYRSSKRKYHKVRENCLMLCFISAIPLVGSLFQLHLRGYPILWVSSAISLLITFVNIQNNQISLDGLTGINNRRALNRFIDMKFDYKHKNLSSYLVLIDIDNFKKINDTYGHVVGDQALVQAAVILKNVCTNSHDFLARYGGDEFAIVSDRQNVYLLKQLTDEITYEFEQFNRKKLFDFNITVSMGASDFDDANSQDEIIATADENLYEVKRAKKLDV